MAVRLFVGNLSYATTEADLRTYFGTVAAYQLLRGKHGGTGEAALAIAQSRAEQAASALEGADAEEFRAAFAACREALVTLLPPRPADKAPAERVLRRGENSFELPCSVCSAPAVLATTTASVPPAPGQPRVRGSEARCVKLGGRDMGGAIGV